MSWATVNYGYWEFWEDYDPPSQTFGSQKVTFDGENKLIYVNSGETDVSVKDDIYSAWKEWVQVRNNAQFEDAIRTTGGDPVGGGLYSGDIYFMINNWKIVIQEQVNVTGIIYDETPGNSPFIVAPGGGVRNIVSNLAYAYDTTGGTSTAPTVQEIRTELDTNSTKLTSILSRVNTLPVANAIAANVWNYSVRELTANLTPEEFWEYLITNPMPAGSAGEKLKQVLTTANFLALK